MRFSVLALAAIWPVMADAACLDPATAEGPFRLVDAEGSIAIHEVRPDGMVQIDIDYGDGTARRELRRDGLYALRGVDLQDGAPVPGGIVEFTYSDDAEVRTHEDGATAMTVRSIMRFDDGVSSDWVLRYRFDPVRQVTIDGCAYRVEEVQVEMQGPLAVPQIEIWWNFVDLGIAHLQHSGVGNLDFPTPLVEMHAHDGLK